MSMLKQKIMQIADNSEVKTYDVKEVVVVDADLLHNIHISIEIMKCENGDYHITESDIEVPTRIKSLYLPKHLEDVLILDSVHDWSDELKELHYHFVTVRAVSITILIKVIKYFFNVSKYTIS